MNKLTILVISDLHAVVGNSEHNDTRLIFDNGISEFGEGIVNFISGLNRKIDILICSGDISNKACPEGFKSGWEYINGVKEKLNIPNILCVPGNHDHDSRKNTSYNPKHYLQFSTPSFPFEVHEKNTHFWAWNWCDVQIEHCNAILLNSSAYHGYGDFKDDETDESYHGRVATEVVDQIYNYVSSDRYPQKKFNILVCHHHPIKMEQVDCDFDTEAMEGGQYLISKLQGLDKGPWFIVHGHKHFAELTYGPTNTGTPPTILSAGSLSAKLYPSLKDRTSNQMYFVDIDLDKTQEYERLVGKFDVYEWSMDAGWSPSKSKNLPAKGGFGGWTTLNQVFTKVKELFEDGRPFLNESDLEPIYNMMDYFTPNDFDRFVARLENEGMKVGFEYNRIVEIGGPCEQ